MPTTLGVPRETFPGERRVALTPRACEGICKLDMSVLIEEGAGLEAGFPDSLFHDRGARIASRDKIFSAADVIVQVRTLGANPEAGRADLPHFRSGQFVVGFSEPLTTPRECEELASRGVGLFAMELMPRITRAQSMDALSSMASLAGYRAAILGALTLPKMFPMMMTAAGTIAPAKVFILGAGVAGLQAIATAKRLGAVVSAYDVRPAVKEQVESVGGKFVTLDIDAATSEDKGGYAKAMDAAFYAKQRELLTAVLREQDVVITTAAVPGQRAPILVTADMARSMAPGSVIVDIAAERGGNCELTRPGETVFENGVLIMGPTNLASHLPRDASHLYAQNVSSFLKLIAPKGELALNHEDPIIRDTLVTHEGKIVNGRVLESVVKASQQEIRP